MACSKFGRDLDHSRFGYERSKGIGSRRGCFTKKKKKLTRRVYHSSGPNELWHADGYDKLKPYGFPIHGCIDGYSRKILWLQFVKSNNNPSIVGKLYLEAVKDRKIVPRRVRTDCGSENVLIAVSQCFLRRNHIDYYAGSKAHLYGSSHHNQRIEAWWSQFRHMKTQFMITFFRRMVNEGELNVDNDLQKACLQYCFGELIQIELDQCKDAWNSHYIGESTRSQCHGRPDTLYHIPSEDFPDQSLEIDDSDLQTVQDNFDAYNENNDDEGHLYFEYFEYLSEELQYRKADDFESARENYLNLLSYIDIS